MEFPLHPGDGRGAGTGLGVWNWERGKRNEQQHNPGRVLLVLGILTTSGNVILLNSNQQNLKFL